MNGKFGGDPMLTVNTLGKFQIIEADVVLDDDKIRSTRLSNLLVYLILHRNKTLTVDEIGIRPVAG